MNRRLLLILICALVGGASISYLVYRFVGGRSGPAPVPMAQVVVAARDLQIGTLIGPGDVQMGPWAGTLPKGALSKLDDALHRGAIANTYQGEPVLADRLASAGSGGGLAAIIPPGMRASGVRVDDVVGLAGFVAPGMRVDVLVTGVSPSGNASEGSRVSTLLQNIQVLSAGTNLQKDSEGKAQQVQVVNLLVTPEQAEKLTLASSQTKIQLVLRNPLDTQTTNPPGTMVSELFKPSSAHPPQAPGPAVAARPSIVRKETLDGTPLPPRAPEVRALRVRVVEVINGAAKTQVTFAVQEDPK